MILNVLLATIIGAFVGKLMAIFVHHLPLVLLEGCNEGREPRNIFTWYFQEPFSLRLQHPIGLKMILLECGIALLFGLTVLIFGLNLFVFFVLIITCLLICCFITDYEHGILPDQFTLALIWVGLIGSLNPIFVLPREAIIGAVGGYGIFWLLNFSYRYFRGFDGMFPGDFKLNAGIGASVGVKWMILILVLSAILLVVITLIQIFLRNKTFQTADLYKEVPYACFASVVTIGALYLLLSGANLDSYF
jgi:leader peptidase (prepilin peptidase)/N-methyltransferase